MSIDRKAFNRALAAIEEYDPEGSTPRDKAIALIAVKAYEHAKQPVDIEAILAEVFRQHGFILYAPLPAVFADAAKAIKDPASLKWGATKAHTQGELDHDHAIIYDTARDAFWRTEGKGYTIKCKEAGKFRLADIAQRNVALSCRYLVPYPVGTPIEATSQPQKAGKDE